MAVWRMRDYEYDTNTTARIDCEARPSPRELDQEYDLETMPHEFCGSHGLTFGLT